MYLAHISEDGKRKQSIKEHLTKTANLAGEFASAFSCLDWGYGCGLLHDIGKYSEEFQKRLEGGRITDHATAGAKEVQKRNYYFAAYCISGHHSGLLDGGSEVDVGGVATLRGRLRKEVAGYHAFQEEIEIPVFSNPPLTPLGEGGFSLSFFIRMVFSCLVDADYLDTEDFMKDGDAHRGTFCGMEILLERLREHVRLWMDNSDLSTINGRRTNILNACFEKGNEEQGLFSLTVPTGAGKTISSLAFALQHAQKHHLSHIIYVIPYTSIIEQNAQIFKDILGSENVLEDHCNVVYEEKEELSTSRAAIRLASENWDCPIVVTTNVQFFESLFSNKTSKCRKLHNISNSVVIFDEAQMLPAKYLKPCIQAISELVWNYHSTAVLCTATQPSLQSFFPDKIKAVEICPNVNEQYEFFRRTSFEKLGKISEEDLIEQLNARNHVLCILNSRKRVQRVYESLAGEGTYHLSTLMYPKHRKKLLQEIRERLRTGQVCRLIATSLVEAGVDFDFETVYRELAGIDSVIQAAGRCNREGKKDRQECKTVIFTLEDTEGIHTPMELKLPVAVASQVADEFEDIASLEAIERYFRQLYSFKGEGLDAKNIIAQMEKGRKSLSFPFASVAKQFRLIENDTKTILIELEDEAKKLTERIRRGEHTRQLVRDAGQYCINLYQNDFDSLNGAGCLEALPLNFYRLRNEDFYSEDMGLTVKVGRGEAIIF